jgi:uncharacterized membrane protein YccF (DUF307 family)
MKTLYWLLVTVAVASTLTLAWQHDGWRTAALSLFTVGVGVFRRDLEGGLS